MCRPELAGGQAGPPLLKFWPLFLGHDISSYCKTDFSVILSEAKDLERGLISFPLHHFKSF